MSKPRLTEDVTIGVIGGGIAGLAAATIAVERGARVVVFEANDFLGGRAGGFPDRLADGTNFEMERGFHAFFRQYYNLRALLRRVDPTLSSLALLDDYPILGPNGRRESFRALPRRTPWNVAELVRRTPTLSLRDLAGVDVRRATEMLRFDPVRTYERWDEVSAREYLDSLRFPGEARRMLFDVFAHSFFNPEEEMSAAELLMMFHFYFVGNPEGLVFDVAKEPFSRAFWEPLGRYLIAHGGEVRRRSPVVRVARDGAAWRVVTRDGAEERETRCDAIVLALDVPALKRVVVASTDLHDTALARQVATLDVTSPFVVVRLWFDRPARGDRAPFVGTAGLGAIDNVSIYEKLEDESREQAARWGGSVVELHAYGVDATRDGNDVRDELVATLRQVYPEFAGATIVEERLLVRQDCPAFRVGSHRHRPGVATDVDGVALAGDFVRLAIPSALMERAAASGFEATNTLLRRWDIRPEPIRSVPTQGWLSLGVERRSA